MFVGYDCFYSVTLMMSELGLPSLDNLISCGVSNFDLSWLSSYANVLVSLCSLQL